MDKGEQTPDTMAIQTLKVASTYLGISVAMLLGSVILVVLFVTDLLRDSRVDQTTNWQTLSIAILFGLVLLGGSIYSILRAWLNYSIVSELEKDGQVSEGTITNLWVDTFEGRPFYRVSYRFREDLEIWENITEDLFEKLCEGCNVPIRFLKYDPTVSRLDYERISAG